MLIPWKGPNIGEIRSSAKMGERTLYVWYTSSLRVAVPQELWKHGEKRYSGDANEIRSAIATDAGCFEYQWMQCRIRQFSLLFLGLSVEVTSSGLVIVYSKSPTAKICRATRELPKESAHETTGRVSVPAGPRAELRTATDVDTRSKHAEHPTSTWDIKKETG